MFNPKEFLLSFLIVVFINLNSFSQGEFNKNDPRWDQPSLVLYPSANYVTLPQKILPMPHANAKLIKTPYEILIVLPNIQVLPSSETSQTEVPLVSCRTNPYFIFGSSNAVTGITINSGSYITTDGGLSWFGSNIINNGNSFNQRGDPAPIIDKNQRVIFTHLSSNINFGPVSGMAAEYSTNFGQNFSASVQVSTDVNADKNMAGTDDSPTSPFYGNSFFAWTSFSSSPAKGRFSRTTNGGITWSAPIIINNTPAGYNAQGQDCDAMPNGNIIVCWTDGQVVTPFTEKFVGVARSADGGLTFSATEQAYSVNGTRSPTFNGWGIRTNGFPRISIDKTGGPRNGWIYIVTSEFNLTPAGSDADIILHRSTDGGITWSAGIRVNQDPLNNGKVQFFPCVRVDESGRINVAYYDNRNFPSVGDSCSVFISRSLDGGNTWTDIEVTDHHFKPKPTPGLTGGYMGDYIGITSGNGKVWAFWMDDKSGTFNAWAGSISSNALPSHDIICGPFLNLPSLFLINQTYSIRAKITNAGTSNETSVPIKFFVNGILVNTTNLNLLSGQTDSVNNNWTPYATGLYSITYASALLNDTNRINDTVKTTVNVYNVIPSLCEGFLSNQFPPQDWTVAYSGTLFWSRAFVSGFCSGSGSAKMDFYNFSSGSQQLITKSFSSTGTNDSLIFLDAYATYNNENDQLQIKTSTNDGLAWSSLVILNGGINGELVTAPPTTNQFTPDCLQWKYQRLRLPSQTNKIQFNAITAFGNNLYMDSICLKQETGIKNPISLEIPANFFLYQNYPNPFNPTTKIQYAIPKAGFVKIIIYDIIGSEVALLVNEFKKAGFYEFVFNGGNIASGVYFYKIESGNFKDVKKMLLIK